jgi:hypothetical protein
VALKLEETCLRPSGASLRRPQARPIAVVDPDLVTCWSPGPAARRCPA